MIQQVQNTCLFHGLPGDDANRHIDKFLEITQPMKQNGVSDDALRLSLFPYSLTHHAIAWYDRIPRNSIHSFDDTMRKFLSKYFPPSMVTKLRNEIKKFEQKPHESLFEAWERYKLSIDRSGGTFMQKTPEECYELIENMTAHHNHWDTSVIQDETSRIISSTSTTESLKVVRQLEMMNKKFLETMRQFQTSNKAILRDMRTQMTNMKTELRNEFKSMIDARTNKIETQNNQIMNMLTNMHMQNTLGSGSLPSNTIANPRGDLKAITTRSGVSYDGPPIQPLTSSLPKVMERVPEDRRAFIDVYGEELTLRVDDEAITFKVGQTLKYSYNDAESINRIDVVDIACEEYRGLSYKQINSTEIDDIDFDLEGDIHLLEELLNNDPSSFLLHPKEHNVEEIKTVKSSINEPSKLELKELPSHLEYAFLEETDKLPVIISKELKDEEKSALLKVLKSHKRAIAWKISDIKGTFQMCMMAIFHDMIEKTMEVFEDDFSVFGDSFSTCLSRLDKMLKRFEDTNLVLN
nr:reverse transcriptase domain-containing protein [Tanacetum cinerariifolium]GFA03313.1 reverse transcriptase domain-containing protein [Tanacetum cinerariifolium]